MNVRLFIYSSLLENHVHRKVIRDFIETEESAMVFGRIFRLEVGYPVFIQNGKTPIKGRSVTLADSEKILPILDAFHGCSMMNQDKSLYHRVVVDAYTDFYGENTQKVSSFIYSLNPKKLPKTALEILNGDWERVMNEQPPLTETLTESQKSYVLKLGRSTGRDIVPINLDHYRDLMNRGLIVDKGRRLALSRLGKEAFRYLE